MTAAEISQKLHGHRACAGYIAGCPAHNDRNPSLSIKDENGKILVHCHAGCEQDDVVDALKARGLWPGPEHIGRRIVAEYNYTDKTGHLLYQVCRLEPKTFRPRRPDGFGRWLWGYGNIGRLLYRLPELLEAKIVFVPEGERDVETLRRYGFTATTNPGGANGWREEFNRYFVDREVIILPDNDPPGWNRALQIARGVLPFAEAVRVLDLPGAKDVTAWFDQGHSEVDLLGELEGATHAKH